MRENQACIIIFSTGFIFNDYVMTFILLIHIAFSSILFDSLLTTAINPLMRILKFGIYYETLD